MSQITQTRQRNGQKTQIETGQTETRSETEKAIPQPLPEHRSSTPTHYELGGSVPS
jgi:hypothetical protein